jgi:hypothetical protein
VVHSTGGVDHPDLLTLIHAKDQEGMLTNLILTPLT